MSDQASINRALRILEVEPGASADLIIVAYRDLVKVWHPDRFQSGTRVAQKAEEKLKEINWAHEVLLEGRIIDRKPRRKEKNSDQHDHKESPKPSCGVQSTEPTGDHADQHGPRKYWPTRGHLFMWGGFFLALCIAAILYTSAKETDSEPHQNIEVQRNSSGRSTIHSHDSQATGGDAESSAEEQAVAHSVEKPESVEFNNSTENPSESSPGATIPQFSDYSAPALYTGPPASIKRESWKDPVPKPISRAMEQSPIFAGEFVHVFWPCGTAGCVSEYLVNKRTGIVVEKAFTAYNAVVGRDEEGYIVVEERVGEWIKEVKIDSALLVTIHVVEQQDLQFAYFENYYTVKSGQLDLLRTIEVESEHGWTIRSGE